ncbi:8037_t:CDS:1, partial [Entrophospora sp. SA101]
FELNGLDPLSSAKEYWRLTSNHSIVEYKNIQRWPLVKTPKARVLSLTPCFSLMVHEIL